jgi:Sec-independent protein translocase protein TatA
MKDPLIILIVILAIVIVWRGPKTLPQIGRMLGRGVKEARREAAEIKVDIHKDDGAATTNAAPVAPAAAPVAPAAAPVAPAAAPVAPTTPVPGPPGSGAPGPGGSGPA